VTERATLTADAGDATSPFTALSGTAFGIDFNPVVDRLRIVSDTGQNLRINVDTGATITDTNLTGAVTQARAAAYSNSFATACRTALYGIDVATDRLILQSPPNDGATTAIGTLGVDVTAIKGFDTQAAADGSTTAYMLVDVGAIVAVYQVNLTTGAATNLTVGGVPNLVEAIDFALAVETNVPQPPGELYGVSAGKNLVSFTRATPGKLCSSVAITGIPAAEAIAGIDFRPSTGALHALTSEGATARLYTVDTTTGAATNPVTIAVPVMASPTGMDFNPTGPVALRIVNAAGQNIRVTDIATGAATADGALNGANDAATAAGYTDAIQGAGNTLLYVLDTELDRLRIQSPPNAGTLVDVGAFGVDLDDLASLDIDGRDNTAYVAANLTGSTGTSLHAIDLATGVVSAASGVIGGGERITAITRTPPTTTLFALQGNNLVTIDAADPSMVTTIGAVTNLAGEDLLGLDIRPSTGVLYGLGSLGGVFTIDPATAVGTRVIGLTADATDLTSPFTALAGTAFGLDFNPTGPVALRVVSDAEQNLRVANPTLGNTFTDTALARAPRTYAITATAYANNIPAASSTSLYALDATNNALVAIASPNQGIIREIGALGATVGTSAAFEIAGPNTGLAVLAADTTKSFVTIDLATGAATTVGAVGVPALSPIVGIATPVSATAPAVDSTVFAVAGGRLYSFARNAPGTVTDLGAITGLGVTETILGIDVRPSTDALWILTRDVTGVGRLYIVNTATAAATSELVLSAEPTDASSPYAGLSLLASYGLDFNPMGAVALRIHGSDGSNLRIVDPTNARVTTDPNLNVPALDVVGAAYTNSFAGATTTTLFVIDAATGTLGRQAPPNDGTVVVVGGLSPGFTYAAAGGFDIAGGNNGLALAALTRTTQVMNMLTPEAFSRLYRVNLLTGATTEIGTGILGTPVRGLAIRIR